MPRAVLIDWTLDNRHTIELGKDDRPSNFLENANALDDKQ